ncbi:sugar ABC transporter ATP-binding protein [Halocella sp. SP3-1]|uniref:sugar ABC transporter ATP-binding protein n=1 Tax=Halocella sp. SP3-1 TaxID=2382161 RepID=UPI000F757BF6|nr:sugar ABC transporter ATP-binding protein [Halocella sp. SP3-1]AZO95303.1 sugar ABC transporter ATP-binding protein [Halocella sp. SP3-1]
MDKILEMKNINKRFYGVQALKDVNLAINRGEVHVLVGENGAGKSTLMKIISGAYQKDSGQIFIDNEEVINQSPLLMQHLGISIIYQEFNLISGISIAENIYLGREPLKKSGLVDWKKLYDKTAELLAKLGLDINPKTLVSKLSVAQQQFVEIAKALSFGAKLIIMDEPSATLTPKELERLFDVVKELKNNGVSIIYISHHLDEIFEIGDRVSVLRDGENVGTDNVENLDKDEIIKMMVGRRLDKTFPERNAKIGEVVLEIKNLERVDVLNDISFTLHKGEILGIAGLVGSGRTELVRALYGADVRDNAEIKLYNKSIKINSPRDSIRHGIGFLPEDRKQQGLVLGQSVKYNITLANLSNLVDRIFINKSKEKKEVANYVKKITIKTPSLLTMVKSLSGGNQQKVVLGKWLFTDSDILIFDEPTRGIDVGAKFEIYNLMNELTEQGKSIIMISSELPEIIGMSDRVLVMYKGSINGEFHRNELDQERIMKSAAGEV